MKDGWTITGLAAALSTNDQRIRDYLSGAKVPEERTGIELGKIIGAHRRNGLELVTFNRNPDIEPEPETLSFTPPERGVYELLAPPGYRCFQAVTDSGILAVDLRYHLSFEERDVVPGLRGWLDRGNPIIRVLSSDPAS